MLNCIRTIFHVAGKLYQPMKEPLLKAVFAFFVCLNEKQYYWSLETANLMVVITLLKHHKVMSA